MRAGSPDDPEILVACLIVGGTLGHVIASQSLFWLLEEAAAGGQVCSCNVPPCDVGLRASIGSSQGGCSTANIMTFIGCQATAPVGFAGLFDIINQTSEVDDLA